MAGRTSTTNFQIFRIQILPTKNKKQFDIESPIKNVKDISELKERKNEFLLKALMEIDHFEYAYSDINHRIDYNSNDRVIIRMASKKDVELTTKNFNREEYEDWPPIFIYLDNRPEHQIILIQKDRNVFSSPEVVANILENNINNKLRNYFLTAYIKPKFEEHEFWTLIDEYQGSIISVNFELISPNLANISQELKLDLAQLNRDTNTHKTNLELNSESHSHLEMEKNNEMINSLVKYSSEGGGDITMKVSGLKSKIHTKNTIKEVEIEEFEIQNANSSELSKILDNLQ
jgi:hypothetical protein